MDAAADTTTEPEAQWVNVYIVTRHYGGPEEGGWWWNRRECLASVPVCEGDDVAQLELKLGRHFASEKWGDIYSMRGGADIDVRTECAPAHSQVLVSGGYN